MGGFSALVALHVGSSYTAVIVVGSVSMVVDRNLDKNCYQIAATLISQVGLFTLLLKKLRLKAFSLSFYRV